MTGSGAPFEATPRAPYTVPVLEALGGRSALTLQQSIVITGVFPADAEGSSKTA